MNNQCFRKEEGRVGDRETKNGYVTQHIRGAFPPDPGGLQIFAVSISN
jgi:hypothetical protein